MSLIPSLCRIHNLGGTLHKSFPGQNILKLKENWYREDTLACKSHFWTNIVLKNKKYTNLSERNRSYSFESNSDTGSRRNIILEDNFKGKLTYSGSIKKELNTVDNFDHCNEDNS